MAHSHSHGHSHAHTHNHGNGGDGSKNIRFAFFLNLFFACIELVGGLLTNSVAILSDALHDFGDSISLGVAWYLQKLSGKGRDKNYSYGYKRFSLLGALFISFILLAGSAVVIFECVQRIKNPQMPHAQGMFALSILGILINGLAVFRMRKDSGLNQRAVMLHMMEDVLGWVAVFIVSIVMMFVEWPILDPLLSIGISIWILSNVYRNLRDTFKVLLQHVPENVDLDALLTKIKSQDDVLSVHDIHLWTLDGEENIFTIHVVTCPDIPVERLRDLKQEIRQLCNDANVHHPTIEFDIDDQHCALEDC